MNEDYRNKVVEHITCKTNRNGDMKHLILKESFDDYEWDVYKTSSYSGGSDDV